jgi:hypothetical protein
MLVERCGEVVVNGRAGFGGCGDEQLVGVGVSGDWTLPELAGTRSPPAAALLLLANTGSPVEPVGGTCVAASAGAGCVAALAQLVSLACGHPGRVKTPR